MRKCLYRNCQKEISGRPNKKYCTKKCKDNEQKYKQRAKKKKMKNDNK